VSGARANIDPRELDKFEALAAHWWDPDGALRTLHDINPVRLAFVERAGELNGRRVLDVGCGGGILAEAMAGRGARVTGIDPGAAAIAAARRHARASGVAVDYRESTAEAHAGEAAGSYDVVTCMELLEHVAEPAATVAASARLVRPGGAVFFATINRTPRAYLLAVLAAEYVLGLLPRGTHDYDHFIRPSELDVWARAAGLELRELAGLAYNPVLRRARESADVGVNYMARFRRGDPA